MIRISLDLSQDGIDKIRKTPGVYSVIRPPRLPSSKKHPKADEKDAPYYLVVISGNVKEAKIALKILPILTQHGSTFVNVEDIKGVYKYPELYRRKRIWNG